MASDRMPGQIDPREEDSINAADGVLTATGEVDRKSDAQILTGLSAAVAGVVAVESHIS